jgi:hypothetical protein
MEWAHGRIDKKNGIVRAWREATKFRAEQFLWWNNAHDEVDKKRGKHGMSGCTTTWEKRRQAAADEAFRWSPGKKEWRRQLGERKT